MWGMNVSKLKSVKDPLALVGLGVYWLVHSQTGFTLSHDEIMVALLVMATVRTAWESFETRLFAALERRGQVSEEASSDEASTG